MKSGTTAEILAILFGGFGAQRLQQRKQVKSKE